MIFFQEIDRFYDQHFGRLNSTRATRERAIENDDDSDGHDSDTANSHSRSVDERTSAYVDTTASTDVCGPLAESVNDNWSDTEREAFDAVNASLFGNCGCAKNCFSTFSYEEMYDHILTMREMDKHEKEMLIMGTLKKIGVDKNRCRSSERKRTRYGYTFLGHSICRHAFETIFDIGKRALENLTSHINTNGKVPREHGNKGRRPSNVFSFEEIKNAITFIETYALEYGLPQPAAPRASQDVPPIYLPASDTKKDIHAKYRAAASQIENTKTLGLSTFKDVWNKCVPHIKISSPKEDACKKCEDLREDVKEAVTDEEKMEALTKFQAHLEHARVEREIYKVHVEKSVQQFNIPQEERNGEDIHYTFDFANALTIPHRSRQLGPSYFVTNRKVEMFGFRVDGQRQYNLLIDENETIGKNLKKL